MLTWFGPGRMRQIVRAERNSSWLSQRRSSTMTRSAHAERPPPKLAIAIFRNAQNRAGSEAEAARSGAGDAAPDGAGSLMNEVRVVRQLALVVATRVQGIRRLPVM